MQAFRSTSRRAFKSYYQPFTLPKIIARTYVMPNQSIPPVCQLFNRLPSSADEFYKLKDSSLFKQNVAYVNGEWIKAKSGKTFEVHGLFTHHQLLCQPLTGMPRPFDWQINRYMPRIRQSRYRQCHRNRCCRLPLLPPDHSPPKSTHAPQMVSIDDGQPRRHCKTDHMGERKAIR